jgi:hypothetical protein
VGDSNGAIFLWWRRWLGPVTGIVGSGAGGPCGPARARLWIKSSAQAVALSRDPDDLRM